MTGFFQQIQKWHLSIYKESYPWAVMSMKYEFRNLSLCNILKEIGTVLLSDSLRLSSSLSKPIAIKWILILAS